MARIVGIGIQNFESIITKNVFYIDKTNFIKEWWESEDSVTPRFRAGILGYLYPR